MTVASWISTTSLQPIAGIRAYSYTITLGLLGPFDYSLWEFGLISKQLSSSRTINLVLEVVEDELFVSINDKDRPN